MKDQDFAVREVERLAKQLFEDWYEAEGSGREWVAKRGLWPHSGYATGFRAVARFVLAREARLVEALEDADALLTEVFAVWRSADGTRMTVSTPSWQMFKDGLPMDRLRAIHSALAAHRAATAPSEPTLESVASEVAFMWERDRAGFGVVVGPEGNSAKALLDKLAALARERRP